MAGGTDAGTSGARDGGTANNNNNSTLSKHVKTSKTITLTGLSATAQV